MFLGLLFAVVFPSNATSFPLTSTAGYLGGGETLLLCEFADFAGPCKLDTGVNFTTIPWNEKTSSLKSVGKLNHVSASGSAMECDLIDVSELSFNGEFVAQNLRWVRCPLGEAAKPLIGLDVFFKKQLFISYSTNSLKLQKPENLTVDKTFSTETSGHIILDVQFKGSVPSKAMFDTGASITSVSQKFYEKNKTLFTLIGETESKDTHGKIIGSQLAILNWLQAGSKKFVAEYVMIMDFEPVQEFLGPDVDFILGFNMISKADWFFDFQNQQWNVL